MSTSNKAFEFVSKNILGHCAHIVQSIVAHGSGSPLFIFYGEDIICNNVVNNFFNYTSITMHQFIFVSSFMLRR